MSKGSDISVLYREFADALTEVLAENAVGPARRGRLARARAAVKHLLERAINTDDSNRAAKLIQNALGIESDEVANYCFPKTWPKDCELGWPSTTAPEPRPSLAPSRVSRQYVPKR